MIFKKQSQLFKMNTYHQENRLKVEMGIVFWTNEIFLAKGCRSRKKRTMNDSFLLNKRIFRTNDFTERSILLNKRFY